MLRWLLIVVHSHLVEGRSLSVCRVCASVGVGVARRIVNAKLDVENIVAGLMKNLRWRRRLAVGMWA